MTNREQLDARAERALAKIRECRNARIERCIVMLADTKQKLAWRRAQGFGYWLGPPERFPSGIGSEIPLFHVTIDPASMN